MKMTGHRNHESTITRKEFRVFVADLETIASSIRTGGMRAAVETASA
jgi:hypothetical protein